MSLKPNVPTLVLVALVFILGMGVAVAAVTIVQVNPDPIAPGEGEVQGSDDLSIESQSLTYSGVNATAVDVVVNNTGTSDHTGDVHISIKDAAGTIVDSTTVSGEEFTGGQTTTVSYTFSEELPVDSFAKIEVVVEQTA